MWRTVDRVSDGYCTTATWRVSGEQPHGAVDDVVEVDGALEELADRAPLGRRQRLDGAEPVDEHAVARVGRAPGRPRCAARG